jgi:hypothetical protein
MLRPSRIAPLVLLGVAMAGCSSGSQNEADPGDGLGETGKVVVTTGAGETFEFENFDVTCPKDTGGNWPAGADIVYAVAGVDGEPPTSRRDPVLLVNVGAEVPDGTALDLPHDSVSTEPETFVSVFITRVGRATELSEAAEESTGRIEVVSASCDPSPALTMRIDGSLHSEDNGGGTATVVGEVKVD